VNSEVALRPIIVLPRAPMRRGLEDITVIHFRGGSVEHRQIEGELAAGSPFFIAFVPLPGELCGGATRMLAQLRAENSPAACAGVLFKQRDEAAEKTRGRPAAT
jgi:hypothetical protein